MIELLKHIFDEQNHFASGGLLLMIVAGLGVYVRAIPYRLWQWVVGQSTMMITVTNDDAAFQWVKEWFLEQSFLKRIRRVDLDTTVKDGQLTLVPGPGSHWFWYAGRPFRVYFYRNDDPKSLSARRQESLTFITIGRRQRFLKRFVQEVVECHRKNITESALFVCDEGYWMKAQGYRPRRMESVILRPREKERLIQDVERFRGARERYLRLGVPYHRGYLLYGPPGTGKTSLVSALAAQFEMSIYVVSLSDFNDRCLLKAIQNIPPNSVVLFEDIDCMKTGGARPNLEEERRKKVSPEPDAKGSIPDGFAVTLSGLLNVLDGFHAPERVLFVMTSNRIEALDQALLRPGRIDYRLFLGRAVEEQKIELYTRFFPQASLVEAREFVEEHSSAETMAEFQGLLLGLEHDQSGWPEADHERLPADINEEALVG